MESSLEESQKEVAALLVEKDNLEAIFDSVTDGIMAHDTQMTITNLNRAGELITGFSREEVLGKKCTDLFETKLCGEDCALCETFSDHAGFKEREVRIRRKNGEHRQIRLSAAVLRDRQSRVRGAVAVLRDITEITSLQRALKGRYSFANIVGRNHRMQELYELIEEVADSDATVLIQGETGTGKELVARAIHYQGPRAERPFIKVDCSALSEGLLESELFGHVKGAFTGAIKDKVGRFELADKGSIFLDEIGEIGPSLQLKLLRVLQDREIERVGEARVRRVDVRVIAATNKNLKESMLQGTFREDLYYRLKVVPLNLPPLRERREDIPLLVEHFVEERNRKEDRRNGHRIDRVSQEALDLLVDHEWRGNVRELYNAIEYAFVKCRGSSIRPEHLPPEVLRAEKERSSRPGAGGKMDPQAIREALEEARWNRTQAARRLGVDRTTLWRKMKEYHIQAP